MEWQGSFDLSDVIAALALLLSGGVAYSSHRLSKAQRVLSEEQARLSRLLLAKAEREDVEANKASVSASLIKKGDGYCVRVFNRGPATARNVDLIVPGEEIHVLRQNFIRDKFPLEVMEKGQSVDVRAIVHLGMGASKFPLKVTWTDDHQDTNTNDVFLTL